jgi:hypothetical protein
MDKARKRSPKEQGPVARSRRGRPAAPLLTRKENKMSEKKNYEISDIVGIVIVFGMIVLWFTSWGGILQRAQPPGEDTYQICEVAGLYREDRPLGPEYVLIVDCDNNKIVDYVSLRMYLSYEEGDHILCTNDVNYSGKYPCGKE